MSCSRFGTLRGEGGGMAELSNGSILLMSVLLAFVLTLIVAPNPIRLAQQIASSKKRAGTTHAPQAAERKAASGEREFTREEVAKHCTPDDLWLVIDGKVYDVTDYVKEHPGGDSILRNAGHDSSEGFHGPQHPPRVNDLVEDYRIGVLAASG